MTGVKKFVSLVETGGNGLLLERTFFFLLVLAYYDL